MSFIITAEILGKTTADSLERFRDHANSVTPDREITVQAEYLDAEALEDIADISKSMGDSKTARAARALHDALSGKLDKSVPNFKAFEGMLRMFLSTDLIDGWIYVEQDDGHLYPYLVTDFRYDSGDGRTKTPPSVQIRTICHGVNGSRSDPSYAIVHRSFVFYPQDVANRRLPDILAGKGIYKETEELRAEFMASLSRYHQSIRGAFGMQFRLSGSAAHYEDYHFRRRGESVDGRRVIHDLKTSDLGPTAGQVESCLIPLDGEEAGIGAVPDHPVVRVFDLKSHDFFWMHSDGMTKYEYDKSLRDKLVLPKSHRDLLDVLTSDFDVLTEDMIEGKSAGNVILAKGIAGVGKTLTAEVYAELIERPLYSIHSGHLGVTASEIEKNLTTIFQRSKRWGCVMLLDECDVFVARRGDNIQQNAIVAEFLRTLEYFDGLLFMTSNRSEDIDEAIISRCAAIIGYSAPGPEDAALIWKVMGNQFKANLSEDLIQSLVDLFPNIAPRDIKMLLRLVVRVSSAQDEELTIDTFRRCAMFRAIEMRSE